MIIYCPLSKLNIVCFAPTMNFEPDMAGQNYSQGTEFTLWGRVYLWRRCLAVGHRPTENGGAITNRIAVSRKAPLRPGFYNSVGLTCISTLYPQATQHLQPTFPLIPHLTKDPLAELCCPFHRYSGHPCIVGVLCASDTYPPYRW